MGQQTCNRDSPPQSSSCGQIAPYYRLAVQRNAGDVTSILEAIKAILLHLSETDENADVNHQYCPYCIDSRCRYQQAIVKCESPPLILTTLVQKRLRLSTDYSRKLAMIQRSSSRRFPKDFLLTIMSPSILYCLPWSTRLMRWGWT